MVDSNHLILLRGGGGEIFKLTFQGRAHLLQFYNFFERRGDNLYYNFVFARSSFLDSRPRRNGYDSDEQNIYFVRMSTKTGLLRYI